MDKYYLYNNSTRIFSNNLDKAVLKSTLKVTGGLVILSLIPKVIQLVNKRKNILYKDKLIESKNKKLNILFDKYKQGKGFDKTKDEVKKYKDTLVDIWSDVLRSTKYLKIEGERTIYSTTIAPFIGFLRCILIRDVYILAGQDIGADRIGFELVFEPDPLKAEEIAKDPFRTKIFTHKWPDHGFKVQSLGSYEANELIDDTLDFLAANPQYLSIRV